MPHESQTFLTLSQAVDAIAADIGQYGTQPGMFHKIAPLVLGDNFQTGIFKGRQRALIRPYHDYSFAPMDDTALGFYLIHMLDTINQDAEKLARICSIVFQTSVRPGSNNGRNGEESGVWIDNHMDDFVCKRCGNCCGLANECTREDYQLWERLGRSDILAWVKKVPVGSTEIHYRIWIDPHTGQPAESCPFLAQQPGKTRCDCSIHDIKPQVCQEYPFTRKHAKQTGCTGFEII